MKKAKCVFIPTAGRKFMTTGWAACRIGASAASFGGDIGFRCGISVLQFPISQKIMASVGGSANLKKCSMKTRTTSSFALFTQHLAKQLVHFKLNQEWTRILS